MYDERQDNQKHQIKKFSFSCHKTPPVQTRSVLHVGNDSNQSGSKACAILVLGSGSVAILLDGRLVDISALIALKNPLSFPRDGNVIGKTEKSIQ
jgi:hypothetical protein